MLDGRVSRHSLLRCLLLCHVSQAIVGHDSLHRVVIFLFLDRLFDLWVYPRAPDLLVARQLVNGEPDVWCRVLARRCDVRLVVHVGPRLRMPCLLRARSFLDDGRYGGRLWRCVVVGLLGLLPWDAHASQ